MKKGQSLIEILIVIMLLAILLPPLFMVIMSSRDGKLQQSKRLQATTIMKETHEALRIIRETGWNSISTNGTYYPAITGTTWNLVGGTEVSNGIMRKIEIFDVYRLNSQIVTSGGTLDPSTKRVVTTLAWEEPLAATVTSTLYLTRYLDNGAYSQTTQADFNTGILANVQTTNTSGGEVILGNNTKAKWCSPAFTNATIDLPDGPPVAVTAKSYLDISIPNDVFTAVSPENDTSIKLSHIEVTANTDPPVPTDRGIFTLDPSRYSNPSYLPSDIDLTNSFKTNDVIHYQSASGKLYALLATNLPDKEVIAIQISDENGPTYQDPVNRIYKYWTFFNTTIYSTTNPFEPTSTLTPTPTTTLTPTPTPVGGLSQTGLADPGANAAENGGDNNGFNSNATNAYTNNSSFAVDSNSGSGTSTSCTSSQKDKHLFYNYDFSFPGATGISGIEVRLDGRVDSNSGTSNFCVQLSWDGGNTWTTPKTTDELTTSETTYVLGDTNDTWGRSWTTANLNNSNFRVRVINVASSTSRDFSIDWVAVNTHYTGGTPTNTPTPTPTFTPSPTPIPTTAPSTNDQAPFGYGAKALTVLEDRAYVASGGYLYVFDLSNIDSKSTTNSLDQIGCRIELDGFDCNPGSGTNRKYSAGQTGTTWSTTGSPVDISCMDGGNIELYASNDLSGVEVSGSNYIYVAVGAGTNPEMNIVNATNIPSSVSSPSISNNSCGRISGGNSGWRRIGTLDFNNSSGTEEAANSVYAKSDGTRAYISSNGGIDANNNGDPDSKQFYVVNTTNKSSPSFLSGSGGGPSSGFYYGSDPEDDLFPRQSLTVLNGERAILVGNDGYESNSKNPKDYQVLDMTNEGTPNYCGGLDFDDGFNDLTSVTEGDSDTFVYMIANTDEKQLKIVEGGPDGTYVAGGVYESAAFDGGFTRAFNRMLTSYTQPANTTVNFQIAIADAVNGSCTGVTYNFVGPDGTGSTFFTADNIIPFDDTGNGFENPSQCMKYKAYLSTTDYNTTPIFDSIIINYSP